MLLQPSSTTTTSPIALLHHSSMILCRDTNLTKTRVHCIWAQIVSNFYLNESGTSSLPLCHTSRKTDSQNLAHKIHNISNRVCNSWTAQHHWQSGNKHIFFNTVICYCINVTVSIRGNNATVPL